MVERRFSIAWQGIEHDKSNQNAPSDPRWTYTGQLRDQCRTVLRQTIDARHALSGLPECDSRKIAKRFCPR